MTSHRRLLRPWRSTTVRALIFVLLLLVVAGCRGRNGDAGQTAVTTAAPEATTAEVATATAPTPMPAEPTPGVGTEERGRDDGSDGPSESPLTTPTALPPLYTYRIVAEYPHDPEAYTQGLVYADGLLYEGTGLNGQSTIRKVELETGEVILKHSLDDDYFGEGVTILDDRVYQLTWHAQKGFVYDNAEFEQIGDFTYTSEGWGLTHDGENLIMSDGTPVITFRDPDTFEEVRRIEVVGINGPIPQLNELEYINGEIFANVWLTDWIVRIDPETGMVVGYIDMRGLRDSVGVTDPNGVLNGIAYDAESDRLFVTGKLWPTIFEIELQRVQQ